MYSMELQSGSRGRMASYRPNIPRQGGCPALGHVTAYVRVPLQVVGLVVGPKGNTIKRIQQDTHTYIITPSREREPIFKVTGWPQNVEAARREIENHVYQRTGGKMPITYDLTLQSGSVRIASYRQRLPRKAKNIYLPTEVWVDVFCYPWTTRKKLAQMVDRIGNRWFAEQLQFYLHEWGKHTLGKLYFKSQGVCKWHNGQYQPLEYPQTAMPENIRFCQSLQIWHFDNQVFNFFRRIQSLLTADTELEIDYFPGYEDQVNNARTILDHLLPFIDGIHTMHTDGRLLPVVKASIHEEFSQIKVLDVHFDDLVQSAMQSIMEWLTTSNNEHKKLLVLYCTDDEIDQHVLETIRQQFIVSTEPSTFVVRFTSHDDDLLNFQCENGIGEQLCGIRKDAWDWDYYVFRHQANAEAGEKLREWVDGDMEKNLACKWKQCICLSDPNIGPGDIFAMPDLDLDEADEEEKPSTSNEGRICE